MQIWIHDSKMRKITALNNDIPDMLSYSNSAWHSYLDQATSTFDFTIPKFSNGKLHEDLKLINDECFVSFYVNGSYQVFYIATLQEDDFNIQLTCNNTNLEYALEYANPFSNDSAQTIEWYLNKMYFLSYAAVEIGINEISDRKRTLTFDSQETKMNRLQSLMSKFEAEFEFKVELNRDGTYKRIVINIYQKDGIGTDRKDVILYYSNGLKGVQVSSDKTQMFTSGIFTGKDGLNLADVEISEKNSDGIEEFYSRKGDVYLRAPLAMQRYPSTMHVEGQDNWINKDFQTEYENVNDLKAYALRTLKQYAYPLITYTASVQSGFVSQYTDLKLGDTIRIIDNNFVGGLALEARVSEMIISFDNPANNSFVFTNYRKIDNKPSAALQTRIEQAVESKLPYRIELATTGGVTFKNNEGETIVKPSLYKGNLPCTTDVTWRWALDSVVTVGTQYRIQATDITDTEVLTVAAHVGNLEVATTEITLTNVNDGKKSSYYSDTFPEDNPKGTLEKGDSLFLTDGDTVKQYYWNGTEWVINPIVSDVEALKKQIAEDLKDVPNREEFENKIAEELANSKAEIETQIETAKTQAESNAKEYADTINQETIKIAEQAKTAADEIKADLVNVKSNLTSTSIVANNAQASVDEAKQDLAEVASDLSTAKQDLTSHAQQLQTQANAQTELTKRVTIVETTANGTKTTVNELTKTVAQNGKDITSVTNRTKTVEDDLVNTKTTLTQVQTTANSTSQKTTTLETGLNGLTAKFETLKIGSRNYFKNSKSRKYYVDNTETQDVRTYIDDEFWKNDTRFTKDYVRMSFDIAFNPALPSDFTTNVHFSASPWYNCGGITFKGGTTALQHFDLKFNLSGAGDSYKTDNVFIRLNNTLPLNTTVSLENFNLYLSAVVEDYTQNEADIESKVAEYKQTADQNYASLQSNLQTLDGTVKQNKSEFDQTASQLRTSISAVEGKIPTDVSTRNLILKSNDFANPHKQNGDNTTVTSTDDYFVIKSIGYTENAYGGMSWNMSISEVKVGEEFSILMPVYIDSSVPLDNGLAFAIKNQSSNLAAYDYNIPTNKKDQWFNVAITFKAYNDVVFDTYPFFVYLVKNGLVRIKPPMLVRGNLIPSDYQPAFEDTKSDINTLSSQIKQTADGMTLLATKTEFNTLSGRVTTAENNITAKANELSSKITSVEGNIPSGEMNLVEYGRPADGYSPYENAEYSTHPFYYNGAYKMYIIKNTATSEKVFGMNRFKVERNTDYTLYFKGFNNWLLTSMDVWFLKRVNGSTQDFDSAQILVGGHKLSNTKAETISVTFNTGEYDEGYIRFDNNGTTTQGTQADLYFGDVSVKKSKSNNGWSPSLAELASSKDLKTAQSEFKQTTDSIKASVQSLDNNTVKNSSLTINTDGVVIKAGKSTSDFANAIGSYLSVNQNAINMFSDKINVKGNMIVSGAITSDKIASQQINTAHLNGKIITADVISSNAVTADAIRAGAVTTDKMSANSINGDRIIAGTLDAAKIKAGSISASQIASGTITSAQIQTGTISAANIAAGAITTDKIAANSINSSKIVSSGITANVIKGGVLTALNNAMQVNLDDANITFSNNASVIFNSSDNALKRVIPDKPSQFIKMFDEVFVSEIGELPNSTLTVIGSNSDRTESSDSSGFGGLRIWNGSSSTDTTSFAELVGNRVAIYGNKNRSPWLFDMTGTTSYLIPQNSNGIKHSLGRSDRPFRSVYADNVYIQGERVAMMLKDIALHIGYGGNNGWVGRIQ